MSGETSKCPLCGSTQLGGLMSSFFVAIDADGSPLGQWQDWESETELGAERCCYSCGWDSRDDEEQAE
jgi:hypothetical protein